MEWFLLGKIAVGIFAMAGGVATLKRRPDWLLFLFVIGAGFGGFYFSYGTNWTPVKVIGLWAIGYIGFLDHSWVRRLKGDSGRLWKALVLWLFVTFFMAYAIDAPIKDETLDLQGQAFRPIVQIYAYLSTLTIVPLALSCLTQSAIRRQFLDVYAMAALVLCAGGFVQLLSFKLGFDFMPIVRLDGSEQIAAFSHRGEVVQRVYSFSGEPKGLSVFLLPLFFVSLVKTAEKDRFPRWWCQWWFVLTVGIIVVSTFSSAALIAMLLCAILLGVTLGPRARKILLAIGLILGLGSGIVLLDDGADRFGASGLISIIRDRTVNRLDETIEERLETQALNYLWNDNPIYLPLGLGVGMYTYHIPGLRNASGVEPIDSGWVTNLLDLGVVGVAVLLGFLVTVLKRGLSNLRRVGREDRVMIACAIAGLLASATLHTGTGALAFIMIWSGLILATTHRARAKRVRVMVLVQETM